MNASLSGLILYNSGFAALLASSVHTLGVVPQHVVRSSVDSLFLTGTLCHSCQDVVSGYNNFNLIAGSKACVE